ncbi:hypothetical protein SAMN05444396_105144 [Flavobacterium segetis]|uniref:Lipoprotein n=1 Tax=Flavobacterium segetis TaxID=271157 RepID=A0A1M5HJW1_9FLAO|nr:DUF6146 family protein [Flavobacterium segetis]SHG16230.1 hypothetical protein SAMN05444396_105144 [Flavobacterium segetis]
MKNTIYILIIMLGIIIGCSTSNKIISEKKQMTGTKNDTIRITNEELEYEVIIIDPGFNTWLDSRALPRNYYSQAYLENKNQMYVTEWNIRASQPMRYNPNLYEMTINYNSITDYGYEVNYLIYNYMVYFQNTYKQKLFGNVPLR